MKEQQEKDKRILLDDHQRIRLAAKAKRLTQEILKETTVLFTPDTILAWYRRLIAQKYDGSKNCNNPGRPKISQEITELVLQFKRENLNQRHTGFQSVARNGQILGNKAFLIRREAS